MKLCECNCGELIPEINKLGQPARYKHGHGRRGKKFPGQRGSPRPTLRGKPTWNKGKKMPSECCEKIRLAHQGKKDGPMPEERKQRIAKAQIGIPRPYARNNPQVFEKGLTPWNKGRTGVYSEERIEEIKMYRAKQKFPIQDTAIEVIIQNELTKLGIPFSRRNFRIRNFIHPVDMFIQPNIVIECDGDWWHSRLICSKNVLRIQRDFIIDYELECLGIKVIRLWEYDINNNLSWCMKYIKNVVKIT